jgi:hypothetical protein
MADVLQLVAVMTYSLPFLGLLINNMNFVWILLN